MFDIDSMLMRKIVTLRERMQAGKLDPLWVEFMLQQTAEGNRKGDFALRPIWASVSRPSLKEIDEFLHRPMNAYQDGLDEDARALAKTLNWSTGPAEVNLTLVSMYNLFLDPNWQLQYEGTVREHAIKAGFETCPDWVIPALAILAEKKCVGKKAKYSRSFNICLAGDMERGSGFATFFRAGWYIYRRNAGNDAPWSGNDNHWLFVKPRTVKT